MATAFEIAEYYEKKFPASMKMDYDNVGLILDNRGGPVTKALVALDVTSEVIDEAAELGAQLIVSHHPMFFELRRAIYSEPLGKRVIDLLSSGIAVISLHTNLDSAPGGVSDCLIEALGISSDGMLEPQGTLPDGRGYGIGRYGTLETEMTLEGFLERAKLKLGARGLRYVDAGRPVRKVAVCGGSGADYIEAAAVLGCDTYVTSDMKYHRFQDALDLKLNVIDADHFCTENVVVPRLARMLTEAFPEIDVEVSKRHGPMVEYC